MRKAIIKRKTKETEIAVRLNIDGSGQAKLKIPIGILNHMLELFAFHGLFDLDILAKGDYEKIDLHHTNEDIGIVLGQAFKKALGNKKGIKRFGSASVPMEEVVAQVTVDISGRGYFRLNTNKPEGSGLASSSQSQKAIAIPKIQDGYAFSDVLHLLESFANNLGMNLNITVNPLSPDLHTTLEPIFKALGLALDQATQIEPRRKGIPSTKGVID